MLASGNPVNLQFKMEMSKKNTLTKETNLSTHTWGISETFDALEDRSANSSHSEGSTTVTNHSPRAEKLAKNTNKTQLKTKFKSKYSWSEYDN
jgi:hypothetical protein